MYYEKIQELKRSHHNKSQVARKLDVDWKTVDKYWDMSPDEFAKKKSESKKRKKKADEYKDFILDCLTKYPDLTTAQIEDWLLERTGKARLPFGERSLRRYVEKLREEYGIAKPENERQYEAVEDPR